MPQSKHSRRDWFLLREQIAPSGESDRVQPAVGDQANGLQPIPQPVNHDGMDLSELPPMREAMLDRSDVQQLFTDIRSLGSNILLMQRGAGQRRADAARATSDEQLETAKQSLLQGSVLRLQIRYRWKNNDWIDTLEKKDDAFRLVRIAHVN